MKRKKVVFALMALIALASCKKEDLVRSRAPVRVSDVISVNNDNSLDYIGHLHNYTLDSVGSNSGFPNISRNQQRIVINAYLASHYDGYNSTYAISQTRADSIKGVLLGDDTTKTLLIATDLSHLKQVCTDNAQNSTEGAYISIILGYIDSFRNGQFTESTFFSRMVNLESTIDVDANLTSDNKSTLLGSCSVTRNSYVYWKDVLATSSHPWHSKFAGDLNAENKDKFIFCSLLADVAGWYIGGKLYQHDVDTNNLDFDITKKREYQLGLCAAASAVTAGIPF